MSLLVFLFFLSSICSLVYGQKTISVIVGVQGSFYDPATISAEQNDTIMFLFGGDVHDVTQSTFENPCTPMPGGFSSGFAGRGSGLSGDTPVWNLQITNVSEPLWFFCAATMPSSHCAEGMVGVINPPSIDMYNSFVAAAKATTPTQAAVSFVSGGQAFGAIATESPMPSSVSITTIASSASFSPTPVTSPISTTVPTGPVTTNAFSTSGSSSHVGAIAGGTAAGGIFCLSAILFFLLYLRHRKKQTRVQSSSFFEYNPGSKAPAGSPPTTAASDQGFKYAYPEPATPPPGSAIPLMTARRQLSGDTTTHPPFGYNAPYAGHRTTGGGHNGFMESISEVDTVSGSVSRSHSPPHTHPPIRPLPSIERLAAIRGDVRPHPYASQPEEETEMESSTTTVGSGMNINTLAKEVAAVLMRSGTNPSVQSSGRGTGPDQYAHAHADDHVPGTKYLAERERRYPQEEGSILTTESSPPHYQSHSSFNHTAA